MVGIGSWLALLALWAGVLWWRRRLLDSRLFLRAMFWSTALGFIAIEAGWIVTEVGRQPWIVQGVMKTSDAVTPMPGLAVPFVLFTVVYVGAGRGRRRLDPAHDRRDRAASRRSMIEPSAHRVARARLSLTTYALLGGADYGGGVWDLLASGPSAERQRATIARAIGPVWEANHVWLIAAIVILFTGFPRAFAAVSIYLHVPLLVVLVGIVLRGSAFVFRAYGPQDPRHERLWGRVFAVASTVTPLFLGVVVGAITEGRLPETHTGSFADVFVMPWLTPFAVSVGVFALRYLRFSRRCI